MNLTINPVHKNSHVLGGILIKGSSPMEWLAEMQRMGLSVGMPVYPVAGAVANQIYGCIVQCNAREVKDLGRNEVLQLVNQTVFIPQQADLVPRLSDTEWEKLFGGKMYIYLPATGLAELEETVRWERLLVPPRHNEARITKPAKGISIPTGNIQTAAIEAPEAPLQDNPFGDAGALADLPFDVQKLMKGNAAEMDKFLKFLSQNPELALKFGIPLDELGAFRGGRDGQYKFGPSGAERFREFMDSDWGMLVKGLFFIFIGFGILIFLIKACSGHGSGGGGGSVFPFMLIFFLIRVLMKVYDKGVSSPFGGGMGSSGSGGGGNGRSILLDNERFDTLRQQYTRLAEEYYNNGDYDKSAHIYKTLLKNPYKAAEVYRTGNHYEQAAALYVTLGNKQAAAECYEDGKMYSRSIPIYKELNQYEKVGDLYTLLNDKAEADKHYDIVLDEHIKNGAYLAAYHLAHGKMGNVVRGREFLLQGWQKNTSPAESMKLYLHSFETPQELETEAVKVYDNLVTDSNDLIFLKVLVLDVIRKDDSMQSPVLKELSYKIISNKLGKNPSVAGSLISLNPGDMEIAKEILRFNKTKGPKKFL